MIIEIVLSDSTKITTLTDKEDGFTGKSGFAIVNQIGFTCSGLSPVNPMYDELHDDDIPIWKNNFVYNQLPLHEFTSAENVHALTTFTFKDGQEIVDFPLYTQHDVLARSNPTFTLEGLVDNTPLLYAAVDENLSIQSQSGTNPALELFQADVELMVDNKVVRIFNYVDCRVTDYAIESDRDKEDGYFKGFALANTFDFDCLGYHPNNPTYDAMYSVDSADLESSFDLRNTDQWGPHFTTQK